MRHVSTRYAGARRRLRCRRVSFAKSATGWSISSPSGSRPCRRGRSRVDESPAQVRARDRRRAAASRSKAKRQRRCSTEATGLLFDHSLFNGHPRFFGYITSSPAPIGMLGDFLAAAVNPNVGAWSLSPLATEIECQTVRWIAELIGFPQDCGGLFVSGGNMANFVGVLAARAAAADLGRARRGHRRAARSRSTRPPRRTPGSRRRRTSSASAPTPIRWIPDRRRAAHGRGRAAAADRRRRRARPAAVLGRRAPPGRSAPARSIRWTRSPTCAASRGSGSTWTAPTAAVAAQVPGAPGEPAGAGGRRLGRRRSAQVAVRAARSGLRAGARSRGAAPGVLVSPGVLPLRRAAS